ncbi:MAG: hypothetical protein FWG82_06620 [Oscillospiraceae bacterium]|nr:hypothetical protein [Oscillospiraceae bacterium]
MNPLTSFYRTFSSQRFPHAVLLEGATRELAASFIAAWLCENMAQEPCGVCSHCQKAANWGHVDVTVLTNVEDKQIPVDDVRALVAQSYVKPNEAARRVFVIENAHKLNLHGQNALLKCIEEPPPSVCFLLLTPNKKELLPTILSRVTLYSLPGAAAEFSEEALDAAEKIAHALAQNDEWAVLSATAPFDKAKPLMLESLTALKDHLRAALLIAGGAGELAENTNAYQLAQLGSARLSRLAERVQELERDAERNANQALLRARISATFFS